MTVLLNGVFERGGGGDAEEEGVGGRVGGGGGDRRGSPLLRVCGLCLWLVSVSVSKRVGH